MLLWEVHARVAHAIPFSLLVTKLHSNIMYLNLQHFGNRAIVNIPNSKAFKPT